VLRVILLNAIMTSVIILRVAFLCHNAQNYYAKYCYAEHYHAKIYADICDTAIKLSAIILNVLAPIK
jgi:hypothetical protein